MNIRRNYNLTLLFLHRKVDAVVRGAAPKSNPMNGLPIARLAENHECNDGCSALWMQGDNASSFLLTGVTTRHVMRHGEESEAHSR